MTIRRRSDLRGSYMRRVLVIAVIGALITSSCRVDTDLERAAQIPAVPEATFEDLDCDELALGLVAERCGYLSVHQTSDSTSRMLDLPVAIFAPTGSATSDIPVVYLHGGPGRRDLLLETVSFPVLSSLNETRTVIAIDQRGSTLSSGNLDCELSNRTIEAQLLLTERQRMPRLLAEAVSSCTDDAVEDGIVPEAFSARHMANDLAALTRALGLDQIDLYGISYGGQVAQVLMAQHPEIVRAAVLDSPLPIATDLTSSHPAALLEALDQLSIDCSVDEACSARFPDLEAKARATIRALDREPFTLDLISLHPRGQLSTYEIQVDGSVFAAFIFSALYDPVLAASVPDIIDQIDDNETVLLSRLWPELSAVASHADPALWWTLCIDEVRDIEHGVNAATGKSVDRVSQTIKTGGKSLHAICNELDLDFASVPPLDPAAIDPSIPLLVLGGKLDPVTASSQSRLFAEALPAARFVEFRGAGHGVINNYCADGIVAEFLSDPWAVLDTECAARMRPLAFADVAAPDPTADADALPDQTVLVQVDDRTFEMTIPSEWGYQDYANSIFWRNSAPYDNARLRWGPAVDQSDLDALDDRSISTRLSRLSEQYDADLQFEVRPAPGHDNPAFSNWIVHAALLPEEMASVRAVSVDLDVTLELVAYQDEIHEVAEAVLAPALASLVEVVDE